MNITTIIELENTEVEKMVGAKLVFAQEYIEENIIETCVECFQSEETAETIPTEDAMKKVFDQLKHVGVIPSKVNAFSFEMPSCERFKKKTPCEIELPQKVILSYVS